MEPLHLFVREPLGQRVAEPAGCGEHRRPERRRADARDALQQLGCQDLAHGALDERWRPRVLQREHPLDLSGRREPPGHEARERVAEHPVLRTGAVVEECLEVARRPAQPGRARPLAEQRAGQLSPALADRTQHRVTLQPGAVEAHGAQGPAVGGGVARHLDAGCRGIEQEHGEAVAAGRRRIGAGDGDAPVGLVHAGGEHLLAVEHEPAGHRFRARGDVRQVAPGPRLGVRAAAVHRARARGRHDLGPLLLGPERHDTRRHDHRGGVDQGRVVVRGLEADHRLPARWPAAAPEVGGQAHPEQARGARPA